MSLAVKCPILGFEETKTMEFYQIDEIFYRLKSCDGEDFSFVMINPYILRPNYDFEIPDYYAELLGLKDNATVEIYTIVAISQPLEESTVNFMAPVVISKENNSLVQVILDSMIYPDYLQSEKISDYITKPANVE